MDKTRGFRIYRFDEIDSTNSEAIRRAREGEPAGAVFVAESQTEGRGREGRRWESPPGKNLYASFLLRPKLRPVEALEVTQMAAVVVREVLDQTVAREFSRKGPRTCLSATFKPNDFPPGSLGPEENRSMELREFRRTLERDSRDQAVWSEFPFIIKPPNDILLSRKKVAGILCEMSSVGEKTHWVVVGIGINVNADVTDFSPEVREIATSLKMVFGREFDREEILERLIHKFRRVLA